ncbi:MAG: hypothetical protein H7A35_04870 [Planctomycetales bacterium]|nr:hypothetical protein [bacterium]UNM09390.1 MAG: hypothetical protein H7A35_04870 [Planctomycetales bacterium]
MQLKAASVTSAEGIDLIDAQAQVQAALSEGSIPINIGFAEYHRTIDPGQLLRQGLPVGNGTVTSDLAPRFTASNTEQYTITVPFFQQAAYGNGAGLDAMLLASGVFSRSDWQAGKEHIFEPTISGTPRQGSFEIEWTVTGYRDGQQWTAQASQQAFRRANGFWYDQQGQQPPKLSWRFGEVDIESDNSPHPEIGETLSAMMEGMRQDRIDTSLPADVRSLLEQHGLLDQIDRLQPLQQITLWQGDAQLEQQVYYSRQHPTPFLGGKPVQLHFIDTGSQLQLENILPLQLVLADNSIAYITSVQASLPRDVVETALGNPVASVTEPDSGNPASLPLVWQVEGSHGDRPFSMTISQPSWISLD